MLISRCILFCCHPVRSLNLDIGSFSPTPAHTTDTLGTRTRDMQAFEHGRNHCCGEVFVYTNTDTAARFMYGQHYNKPQRSDLWASLS